MVLSCDMDNPVILWRLKSRSERKDLLEQYCNDCLQEGRVSQWISFERIKENCEECSQSLMEGLRN